jgi:hypothetical protein
VVSHFAATVRKRALEADSMQDQLSRLSKFANALRSVPEKDMTLELVAGELKLAYDLSCCKISLFEENGKSNPLFSVSSSPSSREDKSSSNLHGTLLEVISEEGTDLQCLALKNKNETVGALLIDRITLSHDAAETIASIVSLVVREQVLSPSCRTSHAQD